MRMRVDATGPVVKLQYELLCGFTAASAAAYAATRCPDAQAAAATVTVVSTKVADKQTCVPQA